MRSNGRWRCSAPKNYYSNYWSKKLKKPPGVKDSWPTTEKKGSEIPLLPLWLSGKKIKLFLSLSQTNRRHARFVLGCKVWQPYQPTSLIKTRTIKPLKVCFLYLVPAWLYELSKLHHNHVHLIQMQDNSHGPLHLLTVIEELHDKLLDQAAFMFKTCAHVL